MALDIRRFAKDTTTTDVMVGDPFNCVMSLRPLRPKLRAKWSTKAGYTTRGRMTDGSILLNASSEMVIAANEWILPKLITGWQGFMVQSGEDEIEFEFSEDNLREIAQHTDLVGVIFDECAKLAGISMDEEEKN